MLSRVVQIAGVILALTYLSACSDTNESPIAPTPAGHINIQNIATSASAGGATGLQRDGAAPAAGAGPRITATANDRVVVGGTQTINILGESPYSTIYLRVGGRSLGLHNEAAGGIDGFYEIPLPTAQTESSVLVTLPQEMALTEFELQVAVASASGAVGPYVALSTTVLGVGTGDVQVTLAWDADADVDLHVVAPGGEEVFYGHRRASTGGELDLDSNAGCEIDGVRNENITWPVGAAPRGSYIVRVDYWANCGVQRTNYTVRVNNGGAVQLVTGFFTGSGDAGGAGSGREVARFERTSGPAPTVMPLMQDSILNRLAPKKMRSVPGGGVR